jgi:hypothetical protein
MTYAALEKLKKNSVSTTLSAGINDSVTTIPVTQLSVFYDVNGVLITKGIVIGYDDAVESYAEEITITGASGTTGAGNLTTATRGVKADGSIGAGLAWGSGTRIAVMFSTGIYDQICDNIAAHESGKAATTQPIDAFGVPGTTNTDRDANTTNHGLLLKAVAPATGLINYIGIAYGETIYALKALFDATNPEMNGTAGPGSAATAARRDHVHASDTSRLSTATAAIPKRSIFLSCAGGWLPTTAPAGAVTKTETSTNKVNINGTLFAAGASDIFKEFAMPMPANYDGGTVTAIPYIFVPTSTDASNHTIKLSLAGVSFGSGDAGDAAYGTKQESTITAAASLAGKIVIGAATSAITIAGTPAGNKWVQWRVGRTGDDTYVGDITLLGWLISYSTDTYSDV